MATMLPNLLVPLKVETPGRETSTNRPSEATNTRSYSSDSDSTCPASSANASPETCFIRDGEAILLRDDGECLDMPICAPVVALERSISELSYVMQEDEHNEEDWKQLLEHLESIPDDIVVKQKTLDLKQTLLKKPEKPKSRRNFTDTERKERNRIAAANSRIKRKIQLAELETEVKQLLETIERKDGRIAVLENEVALLSNLLQQERNSDFYLESIQDGKKKRKRIRRSKQPMLSNSARLGLLCCVSVCLAISPWEQDVQNSYAFAMGGMQHSNVQSIAYVVGFIMIVAGSVALGRGESTQFQRFHARWSNSYSTGSSPSSHNYILPLYWISAAVRRDVGLGNETIVSSHVPKATLL